MKRVMVRKYQKGDDDKWYLVDKVEAEFLTWGVDFEHFDFGCGQFSTAIVKHNDGTVENVPCEHIRFLNEADNAEV